MPAPLPIHLTPGHRCFLRKRLVRAKSYRAWARVVAITMLASGTRVAQVAATLAVTARTISNWKRRWAHGGQFRLEDAARSGRPARGTKRFLKMLDEAVERGPQAYGYIFTVWNSARLAEHLKRKTGIRLSPDRVRSLLHRRGFVYGRPKHTLKSRQNRRKVAAAKVVLEALKKGLWPDPADTNSGSKTKPISICILT